MKPVFKCEYCTFMGTEEQVRAHEDTCTNNYDKKSCFTCKHKAYASVKQFKCNAGREIPEGMMFEHCEKYEQKEASKYDTPRADIFRSIF